MKNMEQIKCKGSACEKNCCLAFNGISNRIKPFDSDIKFSDIIIFEEDYNNIINHGYQEFVEIPINGLPRIKTSSDGVCSAFVDGKCSIYNCRPSVCKAYPFYIDMFVGLCTIKDCCVAPTDYDINKYADDIRATLSVYKAWIDLYENKLEKNN